MGSTGMWRHGDTGDSTARDQLRRSSLFDGLSRSDLDKVDHLLTEVLVEAGDHLTVEGRVGRDFVLIVDGEAMVTKGGDEVARLGPGDVVGEHAMLTHTPRSADVVAQTPMRILVAGPGEFGRLVSQFPVVAERLRDLDRQRQPGTE